METGHLSVTDDQGRIYTIDNEFVKRALVEMNLFSFYEVFFGKTWPDESF